MLKIAVKETVRRGSVDMGAEDMVKRRIKKGVGDGVIYAYEFKRKIGIGGFSQVWLVVRDGKKYALKAPIECHIQQGRLDPTDQQEESENSEVFIEEAAKWGRLSDKCPDAVVRLLDFNTEPFCWMVMELADCDLGKALNRGEADIKDFARLLLKLDKIHNEDIIHRDIKPGNILRVNGEWKFSDFGLSKFASGSKTTGRIWGTPLYMAPEQVSRKMYGITSKKTDIWAMGIMLMADFLKCPPYHVDGHEDMYFAIMEGPDLSDIPEEYSEMLEHALNKDQNDRFDSAHEFWEYIAGLLKAQAVAEAIEKMLDEVFDQEGASKNEAHEKETESVDLPQKWNESVRPKDSREHEARSLFNKGEDYYYGRGVKRSYIKAVEFFRKASELGYAQAQCYLGLCYEYGRGVEQSHEEASKWYRRAADKGYARAQNNLGDCYKNGLGVKQSYEEAVKWYRRAAEQGFSLAQNNLGDCYTMGIGVEISWQEAVKWYRKAADQGNPEAQNNFGWCYEKGLIVKQSYEEAVKWYRKAADQGNPEAQNHLGRCYENGLGVKQSDEKAVKWYLKAAKQGLDRAQVNLGWCYENGIGVEQSYEEAVKWYEKGFDQGNPEAANRLEICLEHIKNQNR